MEKKESRAHLFVTNFFAYGLIGALHRIVPIIMLPVVTRMMTDTAEFGMYNMFLTIMEFGSAIAVLGMYDALFREYFEKDDARFRADVCATTFRIICVSTFIVAGSLFFFRGTLAILFFDERSAGWLVGLAAVGVMFSSTHSIIHAPTRMHNRRKVFVISGFLLSIIHYALAVTLVHMGYSYKGMVYGRLISAAALLLFFIFLNYRFFTNGKVEKGIAKELFRIGLPLAPVFLAYWLFKSIDKIMITNILGIAETGIYAIGARVASISLFIYNAFTGGWQYFAFSTMKDKDQVTLTSRIMEYLAVVSFLGTFAVTLVADHIFNFVFTRDYILGVVVFPFLFLSTLVLMLFQTVANQFLVVKRSYVVPICLCLGVFVSVVLNLLGIRLFGIVGAALATLLGYSVSLCVAVIVAQRWKLISCSWRFLAVCAAAVGFVGLQFSSVSDVLNLIYFIVCLTVCITIYRTDLHNLTKSLRSVK